MGNGDGVIVAVIMASMITTGVIGTIFAIRKGNSGFAGSVKYKEDRRERKE